MKSSASRMKVPGSMLCALLVGCALGGPTLTATAGSSSWDLAVLEKILASVPPEEPLVQVGDMQIRTDLLRNWRDQLTGHPETSFAFDGIAPAWTGGNIYFSFDASVPPSKQKVFLDGAAEWAMFANLHFVPRTAQANYITIKENPTLGGGQSAVGMVGGQQFLEIGPGALSRSIICHEIGHALGMIHEHQRSDRDSFVTILTTNLIPGTEANFVKLANSLNTGAYDFLSVMHYRRDAYSVNPAVLNTIEPLPAYASFLNVFGQQYDQVLSPGDRSGMASKYGAGPALSSVVTNTLDSGPGSLRAALYYALDHPGTTITFNIPTSDAGFGGGVFTIQPTDNLPGLMRATTIDGSSQPTNSNPNGPEIVLNGALCDPVSVYADGLRLTGTNCVVQSLIINGFSGSGINITGTNAINNSVRGCYLGVNSSGTAAVTNRYDPIVISSGASRNTIGGTNAAARNIISGSAIGGLAIRDVGTRSNTVAGNYIGLNASGTAALPNANAGAIIYGGAQGNVIGGTNAGSGNVISGNLYEGLGIAGANTTDNLVAGNLIGLNAAGTAAVPNSWAGVSIFFGATSNTIGGASAAARNVISGNSQVGLTISEAGTSGNLIAGNVIGLNPSGSAALPNGWSGLEIAGAAASNVIGGSVASAGNVISGNSQYGLTLSGGSSDGNVIRGNYIGLDATGTFALANGWSGLSIGSGARGNIIGGTIATAGNVVSGNLNYGVTLAGANTSGNLVQGNRIGLNAAGTLAVGNGWDGVSLYGGATSNVIGLAVNGTGAANQIAFNAGGGMVLFDANTTENSLRGNNVFSNNFLGINLFGGTEGFYGVTFNDLDDSDTGPNQLQNYPVITNAVGSGPNTILAGTFNGMVNRPVLIDLYRNDALHASGSGEGQRHVSSTPATTDANGAANFFLIISGNFSGQYFTATATDQITGNTSEFSLGLLATNGPALPNFTASPTLTSTGLLAQLSLTIGQNYRVQATTNLSGQPVAWVDLTNFTASVTNYTFLDRAATNFPQRFYRIISP